MHALDTALRLTLRSPGHFRALAPEHYWNMVGPYGGITAAMLLNAVLRDDRTIGEPLVLTVNYCAPVRAGPVDIVLRLARTNRTTQHWRVEMRQPPAADEDADNDDGDGAAGAGNGADGTGTAAEATTVAQAQVVTGMRRDRWSLPAANPPGLPPPETLKRRQPREGIRWFEHYDIRLATNPMKSEDPAAPVLSWLRDDPPRPLDYPALAGLADTFFPGIFAHRKAVVPIATVSMNVYFHTTAGELRAIGSDWLSGRTRSNVFRGGFFDCESQIWHRDALIATTQQAVWYRD
ncbi:MAG: acyl-CoA thioesterase [Lautropia sp.]